MQHAAASSSNPPGSPPAFPSFPPLFPLGRYRAPELLYGARCYDCGIDLWAIGCIFGELINGSPIFPGESDIDQLSCVLRQLGTPTEENWPEAQSYPDFDKVSFDFTAGAPAASLLSDASPEVMMAVLHGWL